MRRRCSRDNTAGALRHKSMELELIRHGRTAWQEDGRYQGRSDVPLSEPGRRALSPAAVCPPVVYVTTLQRTAQTAEILFPDARQIPVPGLEEMDFGQFEGRNSMEMEHDSAYRQWVDGGCTGQCPGGESRNEFCQRVVRAFDAWMETLLAEKAESAVLVAHGGTLMAVLGRYGQPPRPYFHWSTDSGTGYRVKADHWPEEKVLEVVEPISYLRS